MRVLLTEGSSLTSREVITCLGPLGWQLEALDPNPVCLARVSRWVRKVHRCPPASVQPVRYLKRLEHVVAERRIEVVLPTHEQAWLLAAAKPMLAPDLPLAVADIEACDRVQSKIEFARLLDDLGLPQPAWRLIRDQQDTAGLPFPYWLKRAYSTAGQGVRLITDERTRDRSLDDLFSRDRGPVMAQQPARGQYAQVQGLFDHGHLVAVHTSVQAGRGVGGSAAARRSVDDPGARHDIAEVGAALGWHGGLTLDYFAADGERQYIECNPRTVEPANANASGVNLPELQAQLTLGTLPSAPLRIGRPGVRTHGTIALLLGAAERTPSRSAVAAELGRALLRRATYHGSAEQLTPIIRDPPSAAAFLLVSARLLCSPTSAERLSGETVSRYSVTRDSVAAVRASASSILNPQCR